MYNKCFEYDWSCGRAYKIVKNEDELSQIKEIFRKTYKYYKDCYKYYASLNPIGDVWALS